MHATASILPGRPADDIFIELLQKLQRIRNVRRSLDDREIAEESTLDILLDMMSAKLKGQVVTVTSLCAAAGVPQTTALRRIDALERAALVKRVRDEADRRRVNVILTKAGEERVTSYLSGVAHLLS
jgi:DNA-binding MarR family transcriptional regulator